MSTNGVRDYRPKIHFTTQKGWINDPNGLVYENGRYHLFYQFYPDDTKWGPMHWGHAVSHDLFRWEHLPAALAPDELGYIFSGSAVYDIGNTSGLGSSGKAPVIAMFTHSGKVQQQSIAYSMDGINFVKYADNPVIPNPGIKDFRDPKVFYNPVRKCWSTVLAAGDRAHFFASQDLKTWTKTGEFGPGGNLCPGVWECPDIIPLMAPNGEEIWVMLVSMTLGRESGGPKTQYFLGTFNGDTFVCDRPFKKVEWLDPGCDNYAAQTYNGEGLRDRIAIGWASNWQYAADTPTNEYCGQMTLPRKLSLEHTPEGLRLSSTLFYDVEGFMTGPVEIRHQHQLEKEVFGLKIAADGEFEATLSNDIGEKLTFGVDSSNQIYLDRSETGEKEFSDVFASHLFSRIWKDRLFAGSVTMEVVFDVSILEVFADQGTFACAQLVFPRNPYNKITISGHTTALYYD